MSRLLLVLALAPLAACSTARMSLSPPLATLEAQAVDRSVFSRDVRFGPYATREVDTSASWSRDLRVFSAAVGASDQEVSFELTRGEQPVWRGLCVNAADQVGVRIAGATIAKQAARFRCALDSPQHGRWQLELARENQFANFAGTFSDGERTFPVRSTNLLSGGTSLVDAVGFEIAGPAGAAAAVQTFPPEQVWFAPELGDDEPLLAGATTALLMYRRLELR